MKTSTIIAILTASFVSAQGGLEDIPTCALQCALSSLGSTGCDTADIACICQNSGFVTSLVPCVQGACSAAEFETTVQAASALCMGAGVTLSVPIPTVTETSVSSSTVVSSTTMTTEVTSVSTESSSTTMTVTEASTTETSAPTTAAGNGTMTEPPSPSGTDDSAAGRNSVALGGLGAVVALVAALL